MVTLTEIERMAPVLLKLYAEGGKVLEQLMAFKVNMDYEHEVQV